MDLMSSDSESDLEMLMYLSEESDNGDNEESQRRRSSRRLRRPNYMQSLDDAEFAFRFRLTKPVVSALLTELMPFLRVTSTRNHGLPPLQQLLLALRFYALGTMLISVADFLGVSKATAGRIVRDVSAAIANLYDRYIFVHLAAAEHFFEIAGFPRVLAAIDCTHVRIQSPSHTIGEEFRNRKGYFSINVQAACDAQLKLVNVVARCPGSAHDATIFNNSILSILRAQCEGGQFGNRWLLGDSAYPNRPYLLTPLLNPTSEAEQRYNDAHIQTRNTIERTFGVWKRRFPVVALTMRLSLTNIQSVIIATAVLYNICRDQNLPDVPSEVDLPDPTHHDDGLQNGDNYNIRERADLINNYFV